MAEVPNLKDYIRRLTSNNDGEMPEPTVSPWLAIYSGTSGAQTTYTVGDSDSHSSDWGPDTANKGPFGLWVRREGSMLWFKAVNIVAKTDDPDDFFVYAPSFSVSWPDGLDYESQIHTLGTLYEPGAANVRPIAIEASEQGIAVSGDQNIIAGEQLGGGANNRACLFALPANPALSDPVLD